MNILAEGQDEGVIRKDIDIYTMRHFDSRILEHISIRWLLKGETYDSSKTHREVTEITDQWVRTTTGQST